MRMSVVVQMLLSRLEEVQKEVMQSSTEQQQQEGGGGGGAAGGKGSDTLRVHEMRLDEIEERLKKIGGLISEPPTTSPTGGKEGFGSGGKEEGGGAQKPAPRE